MRVLKFSLGQLQTNCYLLIKNNKCLIIDPADEGSFILEELQRQRLKLAAIFATHGHFDHLLAAGEIQKSVDIPLYISEKDSFLMERMTETAKHFLGYQPVVLPVKNTQNLTNRNLLKIEDFQIKVIFTPGHTPGSVSFYFEKEKIIFTGDTLFKNSIGRFDFFYSNKNDLKNSLTKLLKLPENTIVYPGHGEETTIKKEKKNLPIFFQYLK